jgi:hypothetical protein
MPVILATWEAKMRRIMVQGQHRQKKKVHRTHPIPVEKSLARWCVPIIPDMAVSRECGRGWFGQKLRPYLQNNQSKKGLEVWLKSACLASMKP